MVRVGSVGDKQGSVDEEEITPRILPNFPPPPLSPLSPHSLNSPSIPCLAKCLAKKVPFYARVCIEDKIRLCSLFLSIITDYMTDLSGSKSLHPLNLEMFHVDLRW